VTALYQHDPFLWLQGVLWRDAFWWDALWMAATLLCTGWGMTLIALLFVQRRTGQWRRLVHRTVPAFAALLLAGAVVQILKAIIRAPRPLSVLDPARIHVLMEPLRLHSFPSGHSASAAALATWAALRYGRSAWPLGLLALAGGLSRVYVGAHWTFDVLGGWAIGALAALAVRRVELAIERRRAARGAWSPDDGSVKASDLGPQASGERPET
jgi:membrane-associated phospholipid phosphatase